MLQYLYYNTYSKENTKQLNIIRICIKTCYALLHIQYSYICIRMLFCNLNVTYLISDRNTFKVSFIENALMIRDNVEGKSLTNGVSMKLLPSSHPQNPQLNEFENPPNTILLSHAATHNRNPAAEYKRIE